MLIRGAKAILTGRAGADARAAGHDIRVTGPVITAIGDLSPEPGEAIIDASSCVVQPGWIDTHDHLLQTLMKAVPAGLAAPLQGWLEAVPFAYRMRMDEAALRTAARIGLAERLLSGATTFADFHNLFYPGIPFDGPAILFEAASDFGMRFALCRGIGTRERRNRDGTADPMPPERLRDVVAELEALTTSFHDPGPAAMRRLVVAPNMITRSCDPGELVELAAEARRLGLRLHSHLAETEDDAAFCREAHGMTPLEFAHSVGWTGEDVWFAHLVHIGTTDIDILRRTDTGIAHCPGSNSRLGVGIAPLLQMRDAGVRIALGQDGSAANEAGSMLADAHLALYLQRALHGPASLSPLEVLDWGTRGGADILGLPGVGTIAENQQADIVVYELDGPLGFGAHDKAMMPILAGRARARHVLVAGRVVVENGAIPHLDTAKLRADAGGSLSRMMSA